MRLRALPVHTLRTEHLDDVHASSGDVVDCPPAVNVVTLDDCAPISVDPVVVRELGQPDRFAPPATTLNPPVVAGILPSWL